MKPKTPKPRVMWATVNPNYPEAHERRYDSQATCSGAWGEEHTRKIHVLEIRECDIEALVERAAKAMCRADGFKWSEINDPMKSPNGCDDGQEPYLEAARDALTAAGIPCMKSTKQRRARK